MGDRWIWHCLPACSRTLTAIAKSRFPVGPALLVAVILASAGCRSTKQVALLPPFDAPADAVAASNPQAIPPLPIDGPFQATPPIYLPLTPTPGAPVHGMPVAPQTATIAPTTTIVLPPMAKSAALSLPECLNLTRSWQPRLAAQRASLASAEDGRRALESLHLPATLSRQVPIRVLQANLGVAAAAAGLQQAEREADYAVIRSYCAVLYAREQETLATSVVERLAAAKDAAQKALDAGARDATAADVNRATVYVKLAETKRVHAAQGVKRALIALREAIGLGPECSLDVPPGVIPELEARPVRDEVVAAALARRGEIAQSSTLAQVTALESSAQASSCLAQRMQTFAAGSDIHAVQVPQGMNGTDYRPGGVVPEMPELLVGSKSERVRHAQTLNARADIVAATTRNLIILETEDAFLRWEEATQQALHAKEAAEAGEKLAEDLRKDFAAGLKVRVEEVVTARALASQARADYNEFRYRQAVALADLERATGGGFCSGLVEALGRLVELPKPKPAETK